MESENNSGSVQNANYFDDLNYPYNTGSDGPGNCCGFFQPSIALGNAFRTVNGLPRLNGEEFTNADEIVHDFLLESTDPFTPDAGPLDPRIDHSIGRRDIPYLDWIAHPGKNWIRKQDYAGPYSPKKYIYYKSQEGSLTDASSWTRGYALMNYTIIRFAEVLLMAAEAEIEAGSLAKALEYVNLVRARAANTAHWVKNADGSKAEMCGNAVRCIAKIIIEEKKKKEIHFETVNKEVICWENNTNISVNMGKPNFIWTEIPLKGGTKDSSTLKIELPSPPCVLPRFNAVNICLLYTSPSPRD